MKLSKIFGVSVAVIMACAAFIGIGTSAGAEEPKTKIDSLVHMDRWEDFEGNKAIAAYATVTVPYGETLDADGFEWVITRYNDGIVSGEVSGVDMSDASKDVVSNTVNDDDNSSVASVNDNEDNGIVFDEDKAPEAVGADEQSTAASAEALTADDSDISARIPAKVGSVTITNADVVFGLILTFDNSESDRLLFDSIYDIKLEEAAD